MHVGNCLRKALEKNGQTQTSLGLQMQVATQRIQQIINQSSVSTDTLELLTKALGLTLDEFKSLEGE